MKSKKSYNVLKLIFFRSENKDKNYCVGYQIYPLFSSWCVVMMACMRMHLPYQLHRTTWAWCKQTQEFKDLQMADESREPNHLNMVYSINLMSFICIGGQK